MKKTTAPTALDVIEYFRDTPEPEAARTLELARAFVAMRQGRKPVGRTPRQTRRREPTPDDTSVAKAPQTKPAKTAPEPGPGEKAEPQRAAETEDEPPQAEPDEIEAAAKTEAETEPAPDDESNEPEAAPRYRTAEAQRKARLRRLATIQPKPKRRQAPPQAPPKEAATQDRRAVERQRPARPAAPPRPRQRKDAEPVPEKSYVSAVDFSARGATRGQVYPVEVAGEVVRPRTPPAANTPLPFYEGEDGPTLAAQPHHHRKKWTDRQWGAFEENKAAAADARAEDAQPHAVVVHVINN